MAWIWLRFNSTPGDLFDVDTTPVENPGTCVDCGTITRLAGVGRCHRFWERSPHRIPVRATNVAAEIGDPPAWFDGFPAYLVGRHHPSPACAMLSRLGKHLIGDCSIHPQALLDVVGADGPLARALEDFFTSNQLTMLTDHAEVPRRLGPWGARLHPRLLPGLVMVDP